MPATRLLVGGVLLCTHVLFDVTDDQQSRREGSRDGTWYEECERAIASGRTSPTSGGQQTADEILVSLVVVVIPRVCMYTFNFLHHIRIRCLFSSRWS